VWQLVQAFFAVPPSPLLLSAAWEAKKPGSDTIWTMSDDAQVGHLTPAAFQLNDVSLSNRVLHCRQLKSYIGI